MSGARARALLFTRPLAGLQAKRDTKTVPARPDLAANLAVCLRYARMISNQT